MISHPRNLRARTAGPGPILAFGYTTKVSGNVYLAHFSLSPSMVLDVTKVLGVHLLYEFNSAGRKVDYPVTGLSTSVALLVIYVKP